MNPVDQMYATAARMYSERDFPAQDATFTGRIGLITLFSGDYPAGREVAFYQFTEVHEGYNFWVEDLEGREGRPMRLTDEEMDEEIALNS